MCDLANESQSVPKFKVQVHRCEIRKSQLVSTELSNV